MVRLLSPSIDPASLAFGATSGFATSGFATAPSTVSLSALSTMTGAPFLTAISSLPGRTVASFVDTHPQAITAVLASPPAARTVGRWWSALDVSAQRTLATSAPQLIGNLDGVPVATRNIANQVWLQQSVDVLQDTVDTHPGRAVVEEAERQIHMLGEVRVTLDKVPEGPARTLLSVDATGQGRAAVVLGDLATADYVTYLIPGMFFTVDGQIDDWTDDAARIYDEQVHWLQTLQRADPELAGKSVAVVSWMGYETPNLTNIASLDLAEIGRDAIADVVRGLLTEREGDEPYISIVAHSYGSTAALMTLTEYDIEVDALVVVGSPGSAAQSVDELGVRGGNVFVGEAAWDPVPNSAFFGSDPGAEAYGAYLMDVTGGTDAVTGDDLTESIGHNGYFSAGTRSLRNLGLIGIGQGAIVASESTGGNSGNDLPGRIPGRTLASD